ncbi:hypothetical protein PLIIFM63780_003385 [Purpureocillium lilacinum]|nr:hypothetical protein PLIIFM63780_003385 [Purpureocillium lilacinum]
MPSGMLVTGGDAQVRLWTALKEHDSLFEFTYVLGCLGRALDSDPVLKSKNFAVNKTAQAFRNEPGNRWEMMRLLHAIPKTMVRAIVLATVAFDDHQRALESYEKPAATSHTDWQGIYVIGLRRIGQGGKFLTAGEADLLIDGLEQYVEAAGRAISPPIGPPTLEQHTATQFMMRVDRRVAGSGNWAIVSPRFITSDENVDHVRAMIDSLRSRVAQMAAAGMSAGERMVQSPLYVGCSKNLLVRLANYELSQGFRGVNKKLALTTSTLLELGLPVELVIRVAVRTWKSQHLSLAEHLVVTMANSLVYQGGFNATQAGGNFGTASGGGQARELVLGRLPYLRDNVTLAFDEIANRALFETELDAVLKILDETEEDLLEATKEAAAAAPHLHVEAELLIQGLEGRLGTITSAVQEAQQDYETAQVLVRLARLRRHEARSSTAPPDP